MRTVRTAQPPQERVIICAPPETSGLELMRARFTTRAFPRHSHEGYGVGVIEEGALRFFYRGEHLVALPGHINTVNPDEVHTGQSASDQGWTYRMFYFSADFLRRAAEEIAGRPAGLPFFTSGVIEDPRLAGLLHRVHRLHSDPSAPRLERETLLLESFAHLLARHTYAPEGLPSPGPEHGAVSRVKEYLRACSGEDLALDDLARVANLSPYHFIRVFARHTGLTPHAWLMQLRARKARELLRRGEPIAAAAAEAGFADQSHLNKTFKRLMGFTPGQVRNSVQGAPAGPRLSLPSPTTRRHTKEERMDGYVHGYSAQEAARLKDQADTLARLLYGDLRYPDGSLVLEAGCGTGCQTVHLAGASPGARFLGLDISPDSLAVAAERTRGLGNVELRLGDILRPDLAPASVDHVFVCFVLEHLPDPAAALRALGRLLKPEGTLTVIEGDHGSFYCHPETPLARRTVDCLAHLQALPGGDALIGRRLYPLLREAGFPSPRVEPRMVYVDGSRPDLIEGFSRNTFIAMVRGVRETALRLGLMAPEEWDAGIQELERAATPEGTFCYTFFRATATRAADADASMHG